MAGCELAFSIQNLRYGSNQFEKCTLINNLNETKTPFLAFRYSTGHVSDYILRLLTIPPVPNWQQLKTALCELFFRHNRQSYSVFKVKQYYAIRIRKHTSILQKGF